MNEMVYALEEIGLRYEQLTSMAAAIEDAMQYSPNAEKAYYGAQSLLFSLLYDNTAELNKLIHDEDKEERPA